VFLCVWLFAQDQKELHMPFEQVETFMRYFIPSTNQDGISLPSQGTLFLSVSRLRLARPLKCQNMSFSHRRYQLFILQFMI
jgi:hypothetical protein